MRRMGENSHNNRSGGGGATISSTASESTRVLMIERKEVVEAKGEDSDSFERGKQLLHNRRLYHTNQTELMNHTTEEQVGHSVVKKNLTVVTSQQKLAENALITLETSCC